MSVFIICWIAYFTSYIGRLNFSSVMSALITDSIMTISQTGFVNMAYFLIYGAGQIINGFLGDKLDPRRMVFTGLFCSGIVNLLMGIYTGFISMTVLWSLNGYFQSMIWPPIIRIFAEDLTGKKQEKACIDIVSSMAAGTLASYFLSAMAMKFLNWRWSFFFPAILLFSASFFWKSSYPVLKPQNSIDRNREKGNMPGKISLTADIFFQSGLLWLIVPVIIHGIIKDGVTSWVPTYIFQQFKTTPSFAVVITMFLPVLNTGGAYAARAADGRSHGLEAESAAVFFSIAALALFLLWKVGIYNVFLTGILFAVITAAMMAVNTLFINILPLHFLAVGKVATVSGILNALAYFGSAFASFFIGVCAGRFGWSFTVQSWLWEILLALIICMIVRKKGFTVNYAEKGKNDGNN
jgi:sugar phosphate permease